MRLFVLFIAATAALPASAAVPARLSAAPSAHPADAPFIGGHHATYALSLQSSQDQGVLSASGTMTYDVEDACTGWTTAQHLVINYTDRDAHSYCHQHGHAYCYGDQHSDCD